jgi:hypothetical protein
MMPEVEAPKVDNVGVTVNGVLVIGPTSGGEIIRLIYISIEF